MSDDWLDKKNKRNKFSLIAYCFLFLTVALFFVFNNLNIFINSKSDSSIAKKERTDKQNISGRHIPEKEKNKAKIFSQEIKPQHRPLIPQKQQISETRANNQNSKIDTTPEKSPGNHRKTADTASPRIFVEFDGINCFLSDKENFSIKLAMKLYLSDERSKKEILFKTNEIKVIIKKVFRKKILSEIVVDTLQIELKNILNSFLQQTMIEEIEILDIYPVKYNKQ